MRAPLVTRRPPVRPALVLLALLAGLAGACESGEDLPPGLMDREAFVEVYVALRMEALQSPDAALDEAVRDSILAEFDVTADDLVAFAEAHGRDPDYMLEVWRDIEAALNVPVDSTAVDSN